MPTSRVDFTTRLPNVGPVSNATLAALAQAAPVPFALIEGLGARLASDSTPAANPVIRTTRINITSDVTADAALTLTADGSVQACNTGVSGSYYTRPPVLSINDPAHVQGRFNNAMLRAYLTVVNRLFTSGGAGYVAPTCAFIGGLPPAGSDGGFGPGMCVRYITVTDPGLGYPAATTATVQGGNPTVQALASPVIDTAGRITAVMLLDMGQGYNQVPDIVFTPPAGSPQIARQAKVAVAMAAGTPARGTVTLAGPAPAAIGNLLVTNGGEGYVEPPALVIYDTAGAGAVITPIMGMGRIDVLAGGSGYSATAAVVVTPLFKSAFPHDGANQGGPFARMFEAGIMRTAHSPSVSSAPVVT